VDYESHAVALDRNELGAVLVTGGLGSLPALPGGHSDQAELAHVRRQQPKLTARSQSLTVTRR
jgi:hypothetical protein